MFEHNLLAGKVAIVTGGSTGLGAQISKALAALGAQVIVADIVELDHNNLKNIEYVYCDLTEEASLIDLIPNVLKRFENIDFLINSARGPRGIKQIGETSDSFQRATDVSLKAPLILSQSFIKHCKGASGTKSIVNISSISANQVSNESASYHIAKAGLDSLTRFLAVNAGEYGFRVNSIAPGFIVSDRHFPRFESKENTQYRQLAESAHPLKMVGSGKDIANTVLFLCSPGSTFITGQVLIVDGGLGLRDGWNQVNECIRLSEDENV